MAKQQPQQRAQISVFQQDKRTYQNLTIQPETTARALCERVFAQFDLVNLGKRELVRDVKSFGLFHLGAWQVSEHLLPDNELILEYSRRSGETRPKFALLTKDTKEFLFLKEKHISIDSAIPPLSKGGTIKETQGWLKKKKEGKQWKKRWVKLTPTALAYQKDPKDREPLGLLPFNECALSFKVLSGVRTIIIGRTDKAKPSQRPVVYLFCADKDTGGLTIDEWYAAIHLRLTPGFAAATSQGQASPVGRYGSPVAQKPAPEGGNVNMREKAFTVWINTVCARRKIPVTNILTDFDNGLLLIALCDIAFRAPVTSRYAQDITAMTVEQKVSNLSLALQCLKAAGVRFSPITPQAFIDGHKAPILTFLWEIILSYHMRGTAGITTAQNEEAFKKQLLERCQALGSNPDAPVTNFTSSFADGLAFCFIVERLNPGVLDFRDVAKERPKESLAAAFKGAQAAGMPPILSQYDFTDGVDEIAVALWLCVWFDCVDPARRGIFEAPKVAPLVSPRVLMDKLMDGKDNPRELAQVMREISKNEQDRKERERQNNQTAQAKRQHMERLRKDNEKESVSNLSAIISSIAPPPRAAGPSPTTVGSPPRSPSPARSNLSSEEEEAIRLREAAEDEEFRKQQLLIRAQQARYDQQRRLLESLPGEAGSPEREPALSQREQAIVDEELRRLEEDDEEEIYDVTAELKNMEQDQRQASGARPEDEPVGWEHDDVAPNVLRPYSPQIPAAAAEAARPYSVDVLIDEQMRQIEVFRAEERALQEARQQQLASMDPHREPEGRERRGTTRQELESTVNEAEALLSAITLRRSTLTQSGHKPPPSPAPYPTVSVPSPAPAPAPASPAHFSPPAPALSAAAKQASPEVDDITPQRTGLSKQQSFLVEDAFHLPLDSLSLDPPAPSRSPPPLPLEPPPDMSPRGPRDSPRPQGAASPGTSPQPSPRPGLGRSAAALAAFESSFASLDSPASPPLPSAPPIAVTPTTAPGPAPAPKAKPAAAQPTVGSSASAAKPPQKQPPSPRANDMSDLDAQLGKLSMSLASIAADSDLGRPSSAPRTGSPAVVAPAPRRIPTGPAPAPPPSAGSPAPVAVPAASVKGDPGSSSSPPSSSPWLRNLPAGHTPQRLKASPSPGPEARGSGPGKGPVLKAKAKPAGLAVSSHDLLFGDAPAAGAKVDLEVRADDPLDKAMADLLNS